MSDVLGPLDPIVARNQRAALTRNPSSNFPQETIDFATTKLVTANLFRAIQQHLTLLGGIPLHAAQVEFLTALIQAAGPKGGDAR